ncbi:hypothetical protein CEJ86_33585 [Sinorhizobium meliloti]|uniref:Insertion element IS1 protein InsA helix-turn-helix domain-containing protein n=2 Tax=Rhizobium meliloti TaxID=382 RepID=A0A2J0YSJ6_RHIML|nr:hypothetical protein CEJ86_33585 [Sinorhizobium meliloti]
MTMNGSGVRDIVRVLEISPTTVITRFKNSLPIRSPGFPLKRRR